MHRDSSKWRETGLSWRVRARCKINIKGACCRASWSIITGFDKSLSCVCRSSMHKILDRVESLVSDEEGLCAIFCVQNTNGCVTKKNRPFLKPSPLQVAVNDVKARTLGSNAASLHDSIGTDNLWESLWWEESLQLITEAMCRSLHYINWPSGARVVCSGAWYSADGREKKNTEMVRKNARMKKECLACFW